ncbi:MAG: LmbE family protein, partial [Saprospiraceae bacterium]
IDVGAYLPLKGKSITEIAAESRSQHRCQGFGTTGTRGEQIEYLLQLKGDTTLNNDIMYQINTTWSRVEGGASIGKLLATIEKEFDPTNPSGSISKLFVAKKMIEALPEGYWKKIKLSQIEEVIIACLGLYLEVTANDYSATQGQTIGITCEAINRSNVNVLLNSIKINPLLKDTTVSILLNYNKSFTYKSTITIPDEVQNSTHYWLTKPWTTGMYWVDDQVLRGLPETPKQIQAVFYLTIDGSPFTYLTNVVYKKNESDKGETYRPFEITPPVFVNCDEKSYISTDNSPKKIQLKVTAGIDNINGKVSIAEPESWHATPLFYDFSLAQKGQEKVFTFEVNMHDDYVNATLIPFVEIGNRKYTNSLYIVDYDHIPLQTVVRNAFPKFIKYPIKSTAKKVGYIMGAGDDVPQALRQLGCDVTLLYEADMQLETLSKFDAIVLGIRALNTVNYLKFHNPSLWEYAKNGGTLVYQYNNNFDLVTDKILPFEIKLSRERVTEENAKMKVLDSTNPIFNFPNKIDDSDFNNWVQERGLYFANTWDTQNIRPLLSCNDPNEPTREGVLLVANYGKGKIAYTGLSFFRQLPAGVIGAYKLFANIISYK